MLFDADGKPVGDELPERPKPSGVGDAVLNMRKRIARAEMEEEYGSIGRDE
jgi:hypothetical protein